jgi:hypothetical protein
VLRRIFGLTWDDIIGCWGKLHNEELHNLYSSPSVTRRMRWSGNVARIGEYRNAYRILVGKPEGGRPLIIPDVGKSIILKWILEK